MADPTYTTLKTPMTRAEVLDAQLRVLRSPDFAMPVDAWGAFDEPMATLAADAQVLADVSVKIAAIAKAGVTDDIEDKETLDVHASDVFDERRILGVPTKGNVTFTESSGTPYSWNAGELMFVSRTDAKLILKNSGTVTLPASGSVTVAIVSEEIGAKYNLQASDLVLATPIPGVAMTAAAGTAWITQSGTDDESNEKLKLRCSLKWESLATTGPVNAYKKWALDASSSVNRVRVQEDPGAIYPAAAVTVVCASPTGGVSSTILTTVSAYIENGKRPLGIKVAVISATTTALTLKGTVTVKASKRAAAESQINTLLDTWFAGSNVTVNGEIVDGLGIGVRVYISQIVEIVMSVSGVVDFVPKKADGTSVYVPGTDDLLLSGDAVATLVRSLTYVEVT